MLWKFVCFPFICVKEYVTTFGFTLSICCPVAKVHTALQISLFNIHSLKVKKNGFKPNNTSILSDKYLVRLQLYSFLNQSHVTSVLKKC